MICNLTLAIETSMMFIQREVRNPNVVEIKVLYATTGAKA